VVGADEAPDSVAALEEAADCVCSGEPAGAAEALGEDPALLVLSLDAGAEEDSEDAGSPAAL
jgi:hypothetical protein